MWTRTALFWARTALLVGLGHLTLGQGCLLWVAVELFCKQRITTSTTPTTNQPSTQQEVFLPRPRWITKRFCVGHIDFSPFGPGGRKIQYRGLGGFLGDLGRGMGFGRADFFCGKKIPPSFLIHPSLPRVSTLPLSPHLRPYPPNRSKRNQAITRLTRARPCFTASSQQPTTQQWVLT